MQTEIEQFGAAGLQQDEDHQSWLSDIERQQKKTESQAEDYNNQARVTSKILADVKTGSLTIYLVFVIWYEAVHGRSKCQDQCNSDHFYNVSVLLDPYETSDYNWDKAAFGFLCLLEVTSIFSKVECDCSGIEDTLGSSAGITENNLMSYLALVEQKTNELLTVQAFLNSKVKALPVFCSAVPPTIPVLHKAFCHLPHLTGSG